jgi:hypothetical protein
MITAENPSQGRDTQETWGNWLLAIIQTAEPLPRGTAPVAGSLIGFNVPSPGLASIVDRATTRKAVYRFERTIGGKTTLIERVA